MSYQVLKSFIVFFIISYFIAGFLLPVFFRSSSPYGYEVKKIIPFYSWFLFTTVPNKTNFFEIKIRALGDKILNPPVAFNKAAGYVINQKSIQARLLTQKLGEKLTLGDITGAEHLRHSFEQAFFTKPTEYEIDLITYNPIEQWKNGESESKIIKIFNTAQ